MSDMAIVLVQLLCDDVQVSLYKPGIQLVHELDLRGIRVSWVDHLGRVVDGDAVRASAQPRRTQFGAKSHAR